MKILVVDDNPLHLKLARVVLDAAGHDVNGASAAEQVVDAINVERPDLILLDLDLPGVDGLSLARQLKGNADTASIHVVAVTAYPEKYPRSVALRAGCEGFIVKPINTRELPQQLSQVVAGESQDPNP